MSDSTRFLIDTNNGYIRTPVLTINMRNESQKDFKSSCTSLPPAPPSKPKHNTALSSQKRYGTNSSIYYYYYGSPVVFTTPSTPIRYQDTFGYSVTRNATGSSLAPTDNVRLQHFVYSERRSTNNHYRYFYYCEYIIVVIVLFIVVCATFVCITTITVIAR